MKGIFRNLHRYVLWLVVSFFFWAWIFTLITNAPPGKKVVLYAGLPAMERDALSTALEADKPENIRYVETWMFSDEMFNPANIATGDLFIVATGQVNQYLGTFQPLGEGDFPDLPRYSREGTVYGLCVYDEAAGVRIGSRYLTYLPGETYYLFFNADSKHLGQWNGSADDAAVRIARTFLTLP
jgi:hypothetical protein